VIAGEAKGQRGRIMRVDRERGRAIVEGLNLVKRHLRKSPDRPQGGIVEIEAPIALSNLVRTEERAEKKAEAPA
jgi:large subunit ribosomal protein L24